MDEFGEFLVDEWLPSRRPPALEESTPISTVIRRLLIEDARIVLRDQKTDVDALVADVKALLTRSIDKRIEVLSGGYAQTRVMDVRGPLAIRGNFEPGFRSRFHYKDLNIIMDTATSHGTVTPQKSW